MLTLPRNLSLAAVTLTAARGRQLCIRRACSSCVGWASGRFVLSLLIIKRKLQSWAGTVASLATKSDISCRGQGPPKSWGVAGLQSSAPAPWGDRCRQPHSMPPAAVQGLCKPPAVIFCPVPPCSKQLGQRETLGWLHRDGWEMPCPCSLAKRGFPVGAECVPAAEVGESQSCHGRSGRCLCGSSASVSLSLLARGTQVTSNMSSSGVLGQRVQPVLLLLSLSVRQSAARGVL